MCDTFCNNPAIFIQISSDLVNYAFCCKVLNDGNLRVSCPYFMHYLEMHAEEVKNVNIVSAVPPKKL